MGGDGLSFHGQAQNKSSTDFNFYNPIDIFFCHTVYESAPWRVTTHWLARFPSSFHGQVGLRPPAVLI